jgi:hypothetical protein
VCVWYERESEREIQEIQIYCITIPLATVSDSFVKSSRSGVFPDEIKRCFM